MAKRRPDFMHRFRRILREEERKIAESKRMQTHARKASELFAAGKIEEADRELKRAERLLKK